MYVIGKAIYMKQLFQIVGVLRWLKRFIPIFKFMQIINGIYYSKQIYCLNVFAGIFGLPGKMEDNNRNSTILTKEDSEKLIGLIVNNVCNPKSHLYEDTQGS